MAPVEVRDLCKQFGGHVAVDNLSFDVEAGHVTGFLGPNGAGKSTTLRALLGLISPSSGSATFGGQRYDELEHPAARVGAVLEDASFHPGRSARNHLRVLAVTGGYRAGRVDEVLATVGLADAADRRVGGYSLGMRQRLAIAAALLGDPDVLIFDEPTNGLDPPGISWMRELLRRQAADGRAVLVSSHLLAEVAQSVDASSSSPTASCARRAHWTRYLAATTSPRPRCAPRTPLGSPARCNVRGTASSATATCSSCSTPHRSASARSLGGAPRRARARTAHALARGGVLRADRSTGMTRLLHAELLKLRTTRTFVALTGCAVATSLLLVILTASLTPIDEVDLRTLFASDLSSVFIALLAVIAVTGEWRHRTIASSFLAAPDRVRLLAAKTIAYALAGVVISLAVTATIMLAGTLIVSGRGASTLGLAALGDALWRNLAVAALLGALGVGVGALLRNQIAAVTGLLIVGLAIEPTLATLAPDVAQFGPILGAPSGILNITSGSGGALSAPLAPALAAAVSIAWASATFAAAAALLRRRDLV